LDAYDDLGWVIPRVLSRCPRTVAFYYDAVSQVEVPSWSTGPVVLLGDSCQAVSLLAGQGASLAMGAACILASELAVASNIEGALTTYEGRLRSAVSTKQASGRRTVSWFVPASRFRIAVRNALMNAAARRPFEFLLTRPLAQDGASVITSSDRNRLEPVALA
jgi:2-polyprenyl-6-methoxyphenol hydroxylase-like FAD-dependent oxidoreductase